jgi:hypothetical protein
MGKGGGAGAGSSGGGGKGSSGGRGGLGGRGFGRSRGDVGMSSKKDTGRKNYDGGGAFDVTRAMSNAKKKKKK